jgi:hypothetical protein
VIIQLHQRDLLGRRDIFECCGFRLVSRFEALAVKRVMLSTATAVTARMAQYDLKNERTPGRRYCRSGEGFYEFVAVLRFIISIVIFFFLRRRGRGHIMIYDGTHKSQGRGQPTWGLTESRTFYSLVSTYTAGFRSSCIIIINDHRSIITTIIISVLCQAQVASHYSNGAARRSGEATSTRTRTASDLIAPDMPRPS